MAPPSSTPLASHVPGDMQGLSMLPLLKGLKGETPTDWRDSIYYHYYEFPSVHMVPRQYGIRTKRHKLIHFLPV